MTAELRRDPYGIPHILAGDVLELAYEQGRTTAVDRTWQLEHARLKAEGRTATRVGSQGVAWDQVARRVGIDTLGRRAHARLSSESAAFVDAYVVGVNAGLAETDPSRVEELAGRSAGPWQPWTPLSVFAAHHLLFGTLPTKLWRLHLEERVGRELGALFNDEGQLSPGSNAWAVGGARTRSGLPLIGGDPHRSFESPNTYQQVRLTCTAVQGGFDVAGFTFPGVPGVQHFAHAGQVAWGITNAMADYQDVYVERLTRNGDTLQCDGPQGPEPVSRHQETVEVLDADPVQVDVYRTPRGPVLHGGPGDDLVLSLRTPSLVSADLGFECLLPLLRARSVDDVERALERWVEPVNNLVVADAAGQVRQRVVGLIPDRAEENRWRPVPASDAGAAWEGWLTDLPTSAIGPTGQVVTANNRMTAAFDRVGVEFAAPGRADRISALLDGRDDLTAADFAAIHDDVLLGQPARLVQALASLTGLAPDAEALRVEIATWDMQMRAGSSTAAAYVATRDALVQALAALPRFADLTGANQFSTVFGAWFDLEVNLYLSLDTILSDQGRGLLPELEACLAGALHQVSGDRPPGWGAQNRYRPLHALGLQLAEEVPLSGDNSCVHCIGRAPGGTGAIRGSVARYVWDLAASGDSGWVVPLGSAGHRGEPHAADQHALWASGRLVPVQPPILGIPLDLPEI